MSDEGFQFSGINHLALVCRDMDVTVDFYRDVLGMRLIKAISLPDNRGKHFFFDCGGGDCIAFFWFPDGPEPVSREEQEQIARIPGTMNHVALNVSPEAMDGCVERLRARGIRCTDVVNHDDSERQVSETITESTFVRSIYFRDPDGISLEIAAWT